MATRTIVEMDKDRDFQTRLELDPYVAVDAMLNRGGVQESRRFVAKMVIEEHNTLIQNFMRDVVVPFISGMAEMHELGHTDGRNEGTGKLCVALRDYMEKNPVGLPFV